MIVACMLNPSGDGTNPITGHPYSSAYIDLAQSFWTKLPAYARVNDIIASIRDNQVTLITSGTGSGKTVLVPRCAFVALNVRIAVTLPKQMLTSASAEFQARVMDVDFGRDIGYIHKGSNKKYARDSNVLVYATDGTIVSKLLRDAELSEFGCVIIDEAHERKVQIDFLLYLLKQVCLQRPAFRVVIMSATIDVRLFANYFGQSSFEHIDVGAATNYPIESRFVGDAGDAQETIRAGIRIIRNLREPGDVLFFVTSIQETIDACKLLRDAENVMCVEIYAGVSDEKQLIATKQHDGAHEQSRKVVIATNVAESSLTVPGIRFVIECGLEMFSYYDARTSVDVLERRSITKAQATQRMGRAGRTGPGICFHLYTREHFESLREYPEPSIKTDNIYEECLRLLMMPSIDTVDSLRHVLNDFIEAPPVINVRDALMRLHDLGLIESVDDVGAVTMLGRVVADIRVPPEYGVALVRAYKLHCLHEVACLTVVLLTIKCKVASLFVVPELEDGRSGLKAKYEAAKKKLMHKSGDHMSLLSVFLKYMDIRKTNKLDDWLYKHFLRGSTLRSCLDAYRRLYHPLLETLRGLQLTSSARNAPIADRVLACFYEERHVAVYDKRDEGWSNAKVNDLRLSRDSWLMHVGRGIKDVMYMELFSTKASASNATMQITSFVSDAVIEIVRDARNV